MSLRDDLQAAITEAFVASMLDGSSSHRFSIDGDLLAEVIGEAMAPAVLAALEGHAVIEGEVLRVEEYGITYADGERIVTWRLL